MKKALSTFLAFLILIGGVLAVEIYDSRHDIKEKYHRWQQGPIPETVTRSEFITTREETTDESEDIEKPEDRITEAERLEQSLHPDPVENPPLINLYVPFALQSPFAEWNDVDKEACEEASIIMLKGYFDDTPTFTKDELREEIDRIVAYEMESLGYFEDTTALETTGLLKDLYDIDASVIILDSLEDVKDEIADGNPVLLPAYGRALGNPYFRNDGPLYHMLIAKGYTETHIIVNDPGTRRGEDFLYENDVLWNAIHDWNDGEVEEGEKVMIVAK
ncbi:C39 family peptidase [Patescibacteria group bacterium]